MFNTIKLEPNSKPINTTDYNLIPHIRFKENLSLSGLKCKKRHEINMKIISSVQENINCNNKWDKLIAYNDILFEHNIDVQGDPKQK